MNNQQSLFVACQFDVQLTRIISLKMRVLLLYIYTQERRHTLNYKIVADIQIYIIGLATILVYIIYIEASLVVDLLV